MLRNYKIDYDSENDTLFLYRARSHGGIELGNYIFDFDSKKNLVAIEILDAVSSIKDLSIEDAAVTKKLLQSIKQCKIDVRNNKSAFIVRIYLYLENDQCITAPIHLPTLSNRQLLAET